MECFLLQLALCLGVVLSLNDAPLYSSAFPRPSASNLRPVRLYEIVQCHHQRKFTASTTCFSTIILKVVLCSCRVHDSHTSDISPSSNCDPAAAVPHDDRSRILVVSSLTPPEATSLAGRRPYSSNGDSQVPFIGSSSTAFLHSLVLFLSLLSR